MSPRILRRAAGAALALAAAGLAGAAFIPSRPPPETRTGWLDVVWQTRGLNNRLAHVGLYLTDDAGRIAELSASAADVARLGGLMRLDGRRVTVTGDVVNEPNGLRTPLLKVRSLSPAAGPRFAVAYGNQAGTKNYVLLLCRFPDGPPADPHPKSVYEQWMGSSYPGLDHYWRESSENRVNIAVTVLGPYTMPQPSTSYTHGSTSDLTALATDCSHQADADVDFSRFGGIELQFNTSLGGFSWGGSWTTTLDGQQRRWAMTWMADWATEDTYAHEMGHSLGLPHSSGPYGQVYDSGWDVMSGGGSTDPAVGTRVALHTIGFHKDLLGWIPAARKYVAGPGSSATFDLTRDALPDGAGYQLAQVPIGAGTNTFYTIEARRYAGYDAPGRLPGEAVVIHKVDLTALEPAKVVDADGNGNPNDAGAMWTPGETFADSANGVRVTVLAETATGFRVEVATAAPQPVAIDSVLPAGVMGADYTASFSGSGAEWRIDGGSLPRGLSLSSTGVVTGVPAEAGTFSFTVTATTPSGYAQRTVQLVVAKPSLAEAAVFDQLLGTGSLSADQVRFLDLLGNANGRLDVGDVRAWLIDQGEPIS